MKHILTKDIVISALGICSVFVATSMITIPNGFHGYFNCGDGVLFAFASLVNPFLAFCIGGIGSALADIASGYASYALFTLFIKGLEAVLVSILIKKFKPIWVSFLLASLWMIAGYVLADAFINQSFYIALLAIPTNLIQGIIGILLGSILHPILHSIHKEA